MTAAERTAPAGEFIPAKRGDVVVAYEMRRDYLIGLGGAREHDEYEIGIVTAVTRDGVVKSYRPASGSCDVVLARYPRKRVMIAGIPGDRAEQAMDAARAHHYPGHPDQPMPFASAGEVREALRPVRFGSDDNREV